MLPPGVRILVCTELQEMRKSFDTLALVVQQRLLEDPQSGALYVFVGKRPTSAGRFVNPGHNRIHPPVLVASRASS